MSFGFGASFAGASNFGPSPALQLMFAGASTLDPRITFTRASSGTYFGSDGLLKTAGNDAPRFDYDPATPAGTTGAELITNGDFSQGSTGWTVAPPVSGSTTIDAGVARVYSADGSFTGITTSGVNAAVLTLGKTYLVGFDLTVVSGSCVLGDSSSAVYLTSNTSGRKQVYVTPTTTQLLQFKRQSGVTDFSFDNISVREATMSPRGLLIEEARTNLLLQSRDMAQAAWSKTDVTAARTQVGIDGVANTACLMTEGVAGTALLQQTAGAVTAGSTISSPIYLRRGNTDWIRVILADVSLTDGVNAWFNLATGTKGSVSVRGAGSGFSSSIQSIGGGWYRCVVTVLPNGVYTVPAVVIVSASADGASTRVNNATYIMDAAQLELGAFPTSYIPTTTAAATRSADSAVMTGANFSSWYNQTQGTFVAEADTAGVVAGGGSSFFSATNGTFNERLQVRFGTGNTLGSIVTAASVVQSSPSKSGAVYTGDKAAFAYQINDTAITRGGVAVSTSVTAALPTPNQLVLGALVLNEHLNGHIRSIKYFNTRLPNATLQALTT